MKPLAMLCLALALAAPPCAALPYPSVNQQFKLEINQRNPDRALQALADATGLTIAYRRDALFGVMANPVVGEMDYASALDRMLAGTGLVWREDFIDRRIIIEPRSLLLRPRLRYWK